MAGMNGKRDEILESLSQRKLDELRELAERFHVAVSGSKAAYVHALAADPSVRSFVWVEGREWASRFDDDERVILGEIRHNLVGTSGVAALLGVERPRIGRWVAKGKMPEPIGWMDASPIWRRSDIEPMAEHVQRRRRTPVAA